MEKVLAGAALRRAMLNKCAGSGLDEDDTRAMKVSLVTRDEAKKLGLPASRAGFRMPYFTLSGKQTAFWRVRYLEETRSGFEKLAGQKPLRYVQPGSSHSEVYLPPFIDWKRIATNPEIPLIITEGELKAACATKHGMPTMGLGGVWSFMSKKEREPLLPIFDEFVLKERQTIICFDSDALTNPHVVAAEIRLAKRLAERGSRVSVARLPQNGDATKLGVDDYIVLHGAEAFRNKVLAEAFDFEESEALHQLNQRVLYIRNPGIVFDHEHRLRMAPNSFVQHAFSNVFYYEKKVTKSGDTTLTKVNAARAWLEWPHRSEVRAITYAPGQPEVTEEGYLNAWRGWGYVGPRPGNVEPWTKLLDRIFGPQDAETRKWFEQWCAYPLQHPGTKMATAVLFWSAAQGTGKTLLGHTLMKIYGENATEVKDADIEDERFEWAEYKQFALADDITGQDNRKLANRLKTMITQKFVRLNPKYIPSYSVPDCINYYFTSNDPDALYLEHGDRRFLIHEVRGASIQEDFRREYVGWRDSEEGIRALWDHLLKVDTSDFDPQAPAPMTVSKEDMIHVSRSDLGAWIAELRSDPEGVLTRHKLKGDLFSSKELFAAYDPAGVKRASPNALARELRRAGFFAPATGSKLHIRGQQIVVYAVKNREAWRHRSWKEACAHYEAHHPESAGGKSTKAKF